MHDDLAGLAERTARFERTVLPDPEAHATYEKLASRWREVYARLLEVAESGLVRPLWWPAGA
jgi:sugar (pentulose or hexulose) kinase